MKKKTIIKKITGFLLQLAAWGILVCLAPFITFIAVGNPGDSYIILRILLPVIVPCAIVYFVNYYILVPCLFFRDRKIYYFLSNLLLFSIKGIIFYLLIIHKDRNADIPEGAWLGMTAGATISVVLDIGGAGIALAIRNYLRTVAIRNQLNEEKRRYAEAELQWLRNQLNPHFLFNSLNNISSLICIDSDRAQDSIGRLSELLRYAIYESDSKSVPLEKEVEFMKNYIELMSLRCNEKTEVTTDFDIRHERAEVAPLLLISLIENAFKHGVSTSVASFIRFRLIEKDGMLIFESENSDNHKSAADNSGSGIGLVNTIKRLDLIYGDRYEWEQTSEGGSFKVKVMIDLGKGLDFLK